MNADKINQGQMDTLINTASQKLGIDPNKLKASMESGDAQQMLNNLNPSQKAMVTQLMGNQKAMEAMLNSPQAREFIEKLMGGK